MSWLSRNKGPKADPSAAQKVHQARQTMTTEAQVLQKQIDGCTAVIKARLAKKDQAGARQELLRKQRLQKQLAGMRGKLDNLEQQDMLLRGVKGNREAFEAMKAAGSQLKHELSVTKADEVVELVDEMAADAGEVQEIEDALSNPIVAVDDSVVDDELASVAAELELEEQQKAEEQLLAVPEVPQQQHANGDSKRVATIVEEDDDKNAELVAIPLARQTSLTSSSSSSARPLTSQQRTPVLVANASSSSPAKKVTPVKPTRDDLDDLLGFD